MCFVCSERESDENREKKYVFQLKWNQERERERENEKYKGKERENIKGEKYKKCICDIY